MLVDFILRALACNGNVLSWGMIWSDWENQQEETHGKGRVEGLDSTSGKIVYLLAQGLEGRNLSVIFNGRELNEE